MHFSEGDVDLRVVVPGSGQIVEGSVAHGYRSSRRLLSSNMAANWPGLTRLAGVDAFRARSCSVAQTTGLRGTSRRIVAAGSDGLPPRLFSFSSISRWTAHAPKIP
jgi:hypothetical protein